MNKKGMKSMIKNIIFDIGGVIFDDSDKNLEKVLNKSTEEIKKLAKIAFSGNFKKCLIGEMTVKEHAELLKEQKIECAEEVEYILSPENYNRTFPLMKETMKLIEQLKEEGYKLYLLSNITHASLEYIKNTIDIEKYFDGGVFSCEEGKRKPEKEFYEILLNRYNLAKQDTIFFDDKEKNVDAAKELGINSVRFTCIDDIKENLN